MTDLHNSEDVSEIVEDFQTGPASGIPQKDLARESSLIILKLREDDIQWRIKARKRYGMIFCGLLILQNIVIFGLVMHAYGDDKLENLGIIFSILVTGTLVETGYIIRIIVQWLFSDIKYQDKTVN